jgi:hypothetical protein
MFHEIEETVVRARRARNRLLRRLGKLLLAKLARRTHRPLLTRSTAVHVASLHGDAAGILAPAPAAEPGRRLR